jgi:hypothetical protein
MSGAAEVEFKVGDRVQITKAGTQHGKTGVVVDPDWTGRTKLEMDEDGAVKSYLTSEIELHHVMEKVFPRSSIHSTGMNHVKTPPARFFHAFELTPAYFHTRGRRGHHSGSIYGDHI